MLGIAIAIRIKMGSPVIFTQERAGRNEKPFKIYKFRTMTNEKDANGILLPNEDRITNLGQFLRNTSLDELPQLLNVLKGEIGVIGPRAIPTAYLPYLTEEQHNRHVIRPGLAGLATVNGRNDQSWESKFMYDAEYLKNITFLNDVKILLKVVKVIISQDGIAAEGKVAGENLIDSLKKDEKED